MYVRDKSRKDEKRLAKEIPLAGGLKALGPPWHISIHSAPCFSSTLSRSCSIHQSDSSR